MTDRFQRDLLRGSLDLMVLTALVEGPRYGYSIQKQLREATGDVLRLPAGTLYPLLHKLEDERLIKSRWDESTGRRRKWYELTAAGRRRLQKQAAAWTRHAECVNRLLESVEGAG
jgi:transcriptional regulator